ncbi:MAG: HlyD family efflux transporter periplasmic adaptor subunit [Bacteroidota bacterium]
MLNISSQPNQLPDHLRKFQKDPNEVMPGTHRNFRRGLLIVFVIFLIFCFMPWIQNVQAEGKVTTLLPQDRPQQINTLIDAQLVSWRVREGQHVQRGDTLAELAEINPDFLDPQVVERTAAQADAKENSAEFYLNKSFALAELASNLRDQMAFTLRQVDGKEQQTLAKINTQEAAIENARQQLIIAERQLARTDSLYQTGNKSRADVEEKRRKQQSEFAKLTYEQNKMIDLQNELNIVRLGRDEKVSDFRTKINKAESDRFSALSDYQAALSSQQKLEVQTEGLTRRSSFYHIIAPQSGIVSEILFRGLGETVESGDALLTIVPDQAAMAIEMFVKPVDLPLMRLGQEVRLEFDGWPAIVFSGWPGASLGIFSGLVVGIDNTTNSKGEYRIMVAPREDQPWPDAIRPGGGARGIAMLDTVPLWYEIWRQLNGFPPEFYQGEEEEDTANETTEEASLEPTSVR